MNDPDTSSRQEQAEHEHVAALLRAVDVRAPERLHQRVQELASAGRSAPGDGAWLRVRRRRGSAPRERPATGRELLAARLKPTLAAMAIAVIAGAAVALLTGTSGRSGPSVSAASALTLRAATMSAPHESRTHAGQLDAAVNGVAFPYWQDRLGWRATGARADTVGGRKVTTVFYTDTDGSRIGYAIVAGLPAPHTSGGAVSWHGGVQYRLLREHGAPVVTWRRDGRLCVLSGKGVGGATLLALARWREPGAAT